MKDKILQEIKYSLESEGETVGLFAFTLAEEKGNYVPTFISMIKPNIISKDNQDKITDNLRNLASLIKEGMYERG